MEKIARIEKDGKTYALFVLNGIQTDSAKFVTENSDAFQVGVMERPAGYKVKPHMHPELPQTITTVSEFLYIENGKVEVEVFDEEWNSLAKQILETGDFLIFFRGGHGLTMLEPTRMIEVKQGPYEGDGTTKVFR